MSRVLLLVYCITDGIKSFTDVPHLGFGHVHNHSVLKSANSLLHFPNGFRRRKFALNEFKEDGMRNAESIS